MINHIEKLHNICTIINATPIDNYTTVMDISAHISKQFFNAASAFIFLLEPGGNLVCASNTIAHSEIHPVVEYLPVQALYSVLKNETISFGGDDITSETDFISSRSIIAPLIANGKSFGVTIINFPSGEFLADDMDVTIKTVFSIVSSLIYNGILFKEKQNTSDILRIKNDELTRSLNNQNTLLTELHHRVKNNLQVILSLINLQLQRLINPETIDIVQTIEKRIRSISLVHDKLLWKDTVSSINLNEYIQDIVSDLNSAYSNIANRCKFLIEGDALFLSLNQAVPCGLIINEAITNSCKHAFNEHADEPEIRIILTKNTDTINLAIRDNGTGIRDMAVMKNSRSLGYLLMNALTTSNLKGSLSITSENGVTVNVTFPYENQDSISNVS